MVLPAWIRKILVCPESKQPLLFFEEEGFLFCPASRLKYPIQDDVPGLVIEAAQRLDEEETAALVARAKQAGMLNADLY